jgi:hypothetical protein
MGLQKKFNHQLVTQWQKSSLWGVSYSSLGFVSDLEMLFRIHWAASGDNWWPSYLHPGTPSGGFKNPKELGCQGVYQTAQVLDGFGASPVVSLWSGLANESAVRTSTSAWRKATSTSLGSVNIQLHQLFWCQNQGARVKWPNDSVVNGIVSMLN